MRCRDFVLAAKAGNKIKNFAERAMPEAQKGSIFFPALLLNYCEFTAVPF